MQFAETKKAPSEEGGMQSQHRLCVKWIGKATFCRNCNSTVVVQSGTDKKSVQNERNRKAGDPALPHGSQRDPRKSAFGTCTLLRKVPFSLWRKVPSFPCYGKQERSCSSSKGKRKGRSFCDVTKGTKNTEKGRRLPLPFSNPIPLTNEGDRNFPVCAKFAATAG